jgi:hypothetical protein
MAQESWERSVMKNQNKWTQAFRCRVCFLFCFPPSSYTFSNQCFFVSVLFCFVLGDWTQGLPPLGYIPNPSASRKIIQQSSENSENIYLLGDNVQRPQEKCLRNSAPVWWQDKWVSREFGSTRGWPRLSLFMPSLSPPAPKNFILPTWMSGTPGTGPGWRKR